MVGRWLAGSLFGSKRKTNGNPNPDHNFDSLCFSVSKVVGRWLVGGQ